MKTESKIGSLIFNTFNDSTNHNVDLKIDALESNFKNYENLVYENGIAKIVNDSIQVNLISSNGKRKLLLQIHN